jgi:uncharacterized protein (TIGR03118 family)
MEMYRRTLALASIIGTLLAIMCGTAQAQYQLTNLVSNQSGQALHTDPLLVNAWGLVHGPGGPWWISDNNSGWSTLYSSTGVKHALQVVVPAAKSGAVGSPTGIVFNGSQQFQVEGWPSIFLFATLDGTISGWAPQSNPNQAIIAVNNSSSGASYTALAITSKPSGNLLYAADNAHNKVDVYNGEFKLVTSFTDHAVPAGFSVFGIRDLDGLLYVAYASTSGAEGGFIDIFSESGVFLKTLATGAPLNQPWGFAAAPSNFGALSNTLLVSNNTNTGTINAFNAITGAFVGTVKDTTGKVIEIDQLWGIDFGDGLPMSNNGPANELFFTAGPNNNLSGTFGSIVIK